MSLFTPKEYTTELSPKSIREIDNKTDDIQEQTEEVVEKVIPFIGSTVDQDGTAGLVPAPTKLDTTKFLKGDGTWGVPESGSADAVTQVDITSNLAVGAIPSGATIPAGTTLTELVQMLLITEVAPTISFSITKSGYSVYPDTGHSFDETLTLAVSNFGSAKSIKDISWYKNDTLIKTDTIESDTTGSWTCADANGATTTTTYKAVVTYIKSDNTEATATKTATLTMVMPKYYGEPVNLNPLDSDFFNETNWSMDMALNQSGNRGTKRGGTYRFNCDASLGQRIGYFYPKSYGALTSIKDGNGFSLFDSFTRSERNYTYHGRTEAYYLYILTDPTTVSNYDVTFA